MRTALITRAITDVQKRVEGYHFDMRKHLVEYDDVVNKHRELIYEERRKILSGADLKANILSMVENEIRNIVAARTGDQHGLERDIPGLLADVDTIMPLPPSVNQEALSQMRTKQIEEKLIELAGTLYDEKEKELGPELMRMWERRVMLGFIDRLWVDHLTEMENMRLQAGLDSLRQMRSVDAYKIRGHEMFGNLKATIQHDVAHTIYHVKKKEETQAGTIADGEGGRRRWRREETG